MFHFHTSERCFFSFISPDQFVSFFRYYFFRAETMAGDALKMMQLAQQMGSLIVFIYSFAIPMIVISIVALIIGAVFHGQCAIEPNISIYLIVQGVLVALMYLSILIVVSQFLNTIIVGFLCSFNV